jgi:adhesin transport system outer membrane protein
MVLLITGPFVLSAETIKNAVQFALQTNPAIQATSAEMRATIYELMQLRGEYLPTVEVFGEAGTQRVDDPAFLSPVDNNVSKPRQQIGVNAKLVLFDGFRRANLVYANAARVDGSILRLLDASETMALNAAEAYIDVYRHRVLMQAARRNLSQHRQIGMKVKQQVASGRLPYSDELTIEDRIDSASLALLEVQRSLRDANARYERVIGRPPSSQMTLQSAPATASLQTVTKNAITNNFRVRYAQTQVDQSKFDGEIVLSDHMPQLSLNAGVSYGVNRNGLTGDRTDQYVGLGLRWTLYKGGRKAERNALAELTNKATAEREVAVREVHELAVRAYNNFRSISERSAMLRQQFQINKLIVTVYGEEFEAATRSLLDLLDVERSKFNVEFQKINADASVAFSTYRVLAVQSTLSSYFGVKQSDFALIPNFQERAKSSQTFVFDVNIEPLK